MVDVLFVLFTAVLWLSLGIPAVTGHVAWNTAVSFVSDTNWQAYSGESTMGRLTQIAGLAVQNFVRGRRHRRRRGSGPTAAATDNTNSAHPFENPTTWTNWLQIFLIFLIPFRSCVSVSRRAGWEPATVTQVARWSLPRATDVGNLRASSAAMAPVRTFSGENPAINTSAAAYAQ